MSSDGVGGFPRVPSLAVLGSPNGRRRRFRRGRLGAFRSHNDRWLGLGGHRYSLGDSRPALFPALPGGGRAADNYPDVGLRIVLTLPD